MKLLHATDRKNVPGILRLGLLAGMAAGRMPAVWGVPTGHVEDAIAHAVAKRRVRIRDVVVIEFDVPSGWVKRFSRPGYYYVRRDVPPDRCRVYGRLSLVRAEEE